MTVPAIQIEALGKKYLIGHDATASHNTLRDTIADHAARMWQRTKRSLRGDITTKGDEIEEFWALRDVSFNIPQGGTVGIIGRNGAGKSTLLKILSRITKPTTGRVIINGRVASLLEVGTGFHPELSGRENIFLNGAILGMSRSEIRRKFDQIVDFADIDKFIDTPVKRYSSGMYVRLAFSVAAHLESDILIIDEVLAVGDAQFQKKCLGKIDDVAMNGGRTVLFVSHHMGMITSLCNTAILMDQGRLIAQGPAPEIVNRYYSQSIDSPYSIDFQNRQKIPGDHLARLLNATVEDGNGRPCGEIDIRSPLQVRMRFSLHGAEGRRPIPNFHVYNPQGQCVFVSCASVDMADTRDGIYEAVAKIPALFLNSDTYFIDLGLTFTDGIMHVSFHERSVLSMVIVDPIEETLESLRKGYSGPMPGAVRPYLDWTVERLS